MDRFWHGAPAVALHVWQDAQGVHALPNAAAAAWADECGLSDAAWQALAQEQLAPDAAARTQVGGHAAKAVRVPLADGSLLVWLVAVERCDPLDEARRATAFLDRALGLAGVSVWRMDLRTRRIHYNAIGFHVLGMDQQPTGVAREDMLATVHPDDVDAVLRAADEALGGDRIVDVVARYRNPDATWRTMLTRRVADRDEDGRAVGLAGVSLDLTQQLADRERADTLAARTALVAEAIGVGFWSRDLDSGAAHWDDQMYRIHRRPPAAGPPGFDDWIAQYVHPQDRAWVAETHRRASGDWEPVVDATFRALDDDQGGQRWVQSWTRRMVRDGHRLAFGMHLDVTGRLREQALLQRERARTQFAIEAAEVGVWERALDGGVGYWNDAMYRLRGLDPADPRPIDALAALCASSDVLALLDALVRTHMQDGTPFRHEFAVTRPDGAVRWLVTQGRALRDHGGKVVGMAGIDLDITERREADALRAEMARAEQAERDKAAFLARASHELRTPMNAVLGFTQLLADDRDEPPSPRQRERLARIADAGRQMMALVDDLLELASLERHAGQAQVDAQPLEPVVRQVLDAASVSARAGGAALRRGETDAGLRVRAERRRLVQIVTQLVAHALRRQPAGGGWVEVACRAEAGPTAVVTVRDGGTGYTDFEAATLFEPFLRPAAGRDDMGGDDTGIGLALALRLAQALGGSITVDRGAGNALRLVLPAEPAAVDGRPLRVLCVEDNPVNLLLLRELLALRPGVAVQAAVDGRSAIEMALADPPDVVLLDLQLPDIGGLDVMRRLRAEAATRACVFVALSADAMPDHIATARAAGFDDYWTKPIEFERFLDGIDRLAARQPAM